MKIIYYYLFYRIYSLWKKMPGRDHAFSAMAALGLIIFFNIIFLIIYIQSTVKTRLKNYIIVLGIIFLAIFIINYFIFLYKDHYKKIEERFKNENKKQIILSSIGTIALILITIFFGFFVLSK